MGLHRNLLIVLAHGLRSDALADSNTWPLSTPNFDKLADGGVRLTATSACPADHGGVISLLTGLHARQHGHLDQHPQLSDNGSPGPGMAACEGWPVQLLDAGYHVAGVGCVAPIEPWLDDAVLVESVASMSSARCAYLAAVGKKGMGPAILQQRAKRQRYGPFEPDRLLIDAQDDIDGFIATEAAKMLPKMPTDKPWALIVVYSGPGNDLSPPTIYEYMVEPSLLEEGFMPPDFTQLDALAELDYPRILLQRLEPHGIGRIRADYLGRVSLIDYSMGRLMSTLENRGDASRTWVVVSSDRGHLLGEHGLVGHRSFLGAAVDVPVIIAPPMPVHQKTHPQLISTVDVAATIAAIGGCDLPKAVSGRSLLPVATHGMLDGRPWPGCISEFGRRLMLKTERYKAVFDADTTNAIGLFDQLKDPDELTNKVGDPVAASVLDSLRTRLADMLLGLRAMPS